MILCYYKKLTLQKKTKTFGNNNGEEKYTIATEQATVICCHGTSNSNIPKWQYSQVAILIKDQVNFSVEKRETHDGRLLFLKGITV